MALEHLCCASVVARGVLGLSIWLILRFMFSGFKLGSCLIMGGVLVCYYIRF
jgi:hypothetical protein